MIARTENELFAGAAGVIVEALGQVPGDRPVHFMLTGGPTAKGVYEVLAERPSDLPRERLHVYWGDERCVPPDHPESNFGMAEQALLDALELPYEQVHRIRGEIEPEEAAAEAERELRQAMKVPAPSVPALDLVLLGVGDDGHTASLFPNAPQLGEMGRLFTTSQNPAGYPRVTATFRLLRAARRIFMLAHGDDTATAIRRALDEPPSKETPASLVCPDEGVIAWLVDQMAASELSSTTRNWIG